MKQVFFSSVLVLVTLSHSLSQTISNTSRVATPYTIDFESEQPWTFNVHPWTVLDMDSMLTYGFQNYTFPHNHEAMAYIVFNPDSTTPSMSGIPNILPHSGSQLGVCMASQPSGGQGNNDWFISSKVPLGSGASFSFWAKSYTSVYGLERFHVAVSTTGIDTADFTIISGPGFVEAPDEWTEFSFDLSAYEGQEVHVAIQCVSFDALAFMIDDLVIHPYPVGINPVGTEQRNIRVFPNPVQEYLNITSTVNMGSVHIRNMMGQKVFESNVTGKRLQISMESFESGLYIVQIKTEKGLESRKFMKK